ncbi:hypothetical protein Tco_0371743 [Tanacetum coccineum]
MSRSDIVDITQVGSYGHSDYELDAQLFVNNMIEIIGIIGQISDRPLVLGNDIGFINPTLYTRLGSLPFGASVDHRDYWTKLEYICGQDKEISYMEGQSYALAIGSSMYVMLCTRPDFTYDISLTSRRNHLEKYVVEYIAASDAAKEAMWLKYFVIDLGVIHSISDHVEIFCDNIGVVAQAKDPREHHKTKHILCKYHII